MKLVYRGISYNSIPQPDVLNSEPIASGAYRGVPIQFSRATALAVEQPSLDLTYRHVAYRTQAGSETLPDQEHTSQVPATAIAPSASHDEWIAYEAPVDESNQASISASAASLPPLSIQDRARSLMIQHHVKVTQREEGMLNRLFEEIGVPDASAIHHAGRIQGKIYPGFWTSYDRSHASMS